MYTVLCVVISLVIAFLLLLILAKLKILDFVGEMTGCGTFILYRLILVAVIFGVSFHFTKEFLNPSEIEKTYLTTKVELKCYEKFEKEPYGKEIGTLKPDTVFKLIHDKRKGSITWLEGYVLDDGTPKHLFVVIPEEIKKFKEETKYFIYNDTSKSFNAYYKKIDDENAVLLKNIQHDFMAELKHNNIVIEHSSDNILYESIKKTHKVLNRDGYFGLFISKNGDFYYIKKDKNKTFEEIVSSYREKRSTETKRYF